MELSQLSKAAILNTITSERITVMYNPEEIKLDQGNSFAEVGIPGLDAPPVQYVRGKARSLSMELFFDTYESKEDVRRYSGRIVKLLDKLPQTKAPPVLLFSMGQLNFQCVLADVGSATPCSSATVRQCGRFSRCASRSSCGWTCRSSTAFLLDLLRCTT